MNAAAPAITHMHTHDTTKHGHIVKHCMLQVSLETYLCVVRVISKLIICVGCVELHVRHQMQLQIRCGEKGGYKNATYTIFHFQKLNAQQTIHFGWGERYMNRIRKYPVVILILFLPQCNEKRKKLSRFEISIGRNQNFARIAKLVPNLFF